MNYSAEKNNKVYIMGEIVSDAVFSHEVYGEGFYEFFVRVMRLSGQADILPITVSERLIQGCALERGSAICALGQFRSYNKLENGKSRLMLTVFVREILTEIPGKNPNSILLIQMRSIRQEDTTSSFYAGIRYPDNKIIKCIRK